MFIIIVYKYIIGSFCDSNGVWNIERKRRVLLIGNLFGREN